MLNGQTPRMSNEQAPRLRLSRLTLSRDTIYHLGHPDTSTYPDPRTPQTAVGNTCGGWSNCGSCRQNTCGC